MGRDNKIVFSAFYTANNLQRDRFPVQNYEAVCLSVCLFFDRGFELATLQGEQPDQGRHFDGVREDHILHVGSPSNRIPAVWRPISQNIRQISSEAAQNTYQRSS